MTKPVIGFAGMTHLGLNSAAASAARGFKTLCFDPEAALINRLAAGDLPVTEPELSDYLERHREALGFSADPADLTRCDLVYIAADVPTDDQGRSDLAGIRKLIDQVVANLRADASLVVLCQVPPGFTRELPLAKERLYYQVETLIFGRAVERAMYPERYIVGSADPAAPLAPTYRTFLEAYGCPILAMRYESAELAKISINMCLVASVSVANTMAEICERIGADWLEIVPALKLDRRIGQYSYLAPGLGISGGNLERDLATVMRLAEEGGTDDGVVRAWLVNSRHCKNWALRTLHEAVLARKPDASIAVLGLAYKENTHSTKNSPAIALLEALKPFRVKVYDPIVPASAAGPHATGASSALEAMHGADVVLIMTPWPEFRSLAPRDLAAAMAGRTVIDPYRIIAPEAAREAGLVHLTLGVPPAAA